MKTILISAVFIFLAVFANAQITLENTYAYSATVSQVYTDEYIYFLMDVPQKQCRIYNTDHVLQKTINLSVPDGFYLSDIKFVTKNLFNTDDLIELLYIYEKYISTDTWYYYQYGLGVINEIGTQLLNLPDGAFAEVRNITNENKLIAYSYIYNPLGYYDVQTFVYSLGGSSNYTDYSNLENIIVFPNPARDQIIINASKAPENFTGDFSLFSNDGIKVLSVPVSKGHENAIPVNHLPSGMYIYSINDKDKLIYSNKILIQ